MIITMDRKLVMFLFGWFVLIAGIGIPAYFTGWWQLIFITGFVVGMGYMSIFWYLDLKKQAKKQSKESE